MAEALDIRDTGTARHSQTVGKYAQMIARGFGLPNVVIDRLLLAGVLHDLGKLGIPDSILRKPGPLTELIVRPDPNHPVTARLGSELKFVDEIYLSEGPPADASVLMRTSWRYTEQVVAYERAVGDGRFVQLGLGHQGSTYENESFQKLVQRAVMFAAGRTAAAPVGAERLFCRATAPPARRWRGRAPGSH